MNVTTTTGETVTLVVPFVFAVTESVTDIATGYGYKARIYIKAIGQDQWWRLGCFTLGKPPELLYRVANAVTLNAINEQTQTSD